MNVVQMEKGKKRFSMIDENTWGMLMGKSGKLPGPIGEELQAMADAEGREKFVGNPQDLYPDELDKFRQQMAEKGWETGQDDEELFEFAMHPPQYEDYKSGKAKEKFNADLAKRKAAANQNTTANAQPVAVPVVAVLLLPPPLSPCGLMWMESDLRYRLVMGMMMQTPPPNPSQQKRRLQLLQSLVRQLVGQ